MTKRFHLRAARGIPSSGITLRLLSPRGSYPDRPFVNSDAAYIYSSEHLASVVRFDERHWDNWSEIDHIGSFEIRLFGASLLAHNGPGVPVQPHPSAFRLQLQGVGDTSLADPELQRALMGRLERELAIERTRSGERMSDMPELAYEFAKTTVAGNELEPEIFSAIDLEDDLLLRGVGALLKANMLGHYWEFAEAACIYCYIALDGAFSIVRRILKDSGNSNPTAADAGRFMKTVFTEYADDNGFFTEDYENRIMLIHPENRFGTWAVPPLIADDFFELNDYLIQVYRYFVLGRRVDLP